MAYLPSLDLVPRVLGGDARAIARLLTRAETGVDEARPALDHIFRHAGHAHVVGITGVPGSGKSTLVTALTVAIRATGRKIAIVAIDPSSPFSGGAILGDRIRMGALAGDPGVFVRSMATRGALGGLARGALDAVDVLDAAGFDLVVIETVGVGQDEVDIARAAHTTVVVSAPGLGDDVQAIKAGVLEIADVHVVSKCDRPDANRTIADLKNMLALGLGPGTRYGVRLAKDGAASAAANGTPEAGSMPEWRPPVIATASVRGEGIDDLLGQIDRHFAFLTTTGELELRKQMIAERRLLAAGEAILRDRFLRHRDGMVSELLGQLRTRSVSPHTAALQMLDTMHFGGDE